MTGDLNEDTITAIRHAIGQELDARVRIDPDVHIAHHNWTQAQLDLQKKREERREKVIQQLLGLGAAVGLAWLGSVIASGFRAWMNNPNPPPH